jgi:uncharacterized protein
MTVKAGQARNDSTKGRVMNPEKEYFEHLAQGRFMIQKSRSTGGHVFYPRVAEPRTGATNLALIDLAEGPRMMSRVEGIAPEDVRIGMPVKAKIVHENEQALVVFEPA